MDNHIGRGLTLLSWCLAATGTAMLLISAVVPTSLTVQLIVGGLILFALGAGWYLICLIRH